MYRGNRVELGPRVSHFERGRSEQGSRFALATFSGSGHNPSRLLFRDEALSSRRVKGEIGEYEAVIHSRRFMHRSLKGPTEKTFRSQKRNNFYPYV